MAAFATPRSIRRCASGPGYRTHSWAACWAMSSSSTARHVEHQQLPAFASVSLGDAQMLLSGPGASGSRPMPNGEPQEPGGWNRIVLKVSDLPGFIAELKQA